jgi:polyhydroxybutyrate depolymerase
MRPLRPRFVVLAVAALAAAALGGSSPTGGAATTGGAALPAPPSAPSAPCAAGAVQPGDTTLAITAGRLRRTARIHVPAGALARRAAVLLAFHGTGSNGRAMERYSELLPDLDRDGAIGIFPDADGPQWNASEARRGPDDIGFVRDLLATVAQRWCVDPRRISAAGVSNGGSFAALLACVMSDRLAGVVIVAGGFDALSPCHPRRPVSVLEIHGTADRVAPYDGTPADGRRGAVLPWVRAWARRDGCPARLHRRVLAPRTVRIAWGPCRGGTTVAHIAIFGGGHQWPGATPADPGPPPTISAARQAWGFLAGRRLAR